MDTLIASDDHAVPTEFSLGVLVFWGVIVLIVLVAMAILLRRKK